MKTIAEITDWLAAAPAGSMLPAEALASMLRSVKERSPAPEPAPKDAETPEVTWRERLWTAPPQTRIGVQELMEALGRPRSWIYRHTSPKAAKEAGHDLLPYRKLEGELVFLVGEIRTWIIEQEDIMRRGRMESSAAERAGWRVA